MRAALDAGAAIVNDVSALRHDPDQRRVWRRRTCPVILMHMRGTPQTMAEHAVYEDVVAEVARELADRVARAEAAGIARARLTIDPGFGFAKTPQQSLALLRGWAALPIARLPIVAGVSRKGFVGLYGREWSRRAVPGIGCRRPVRDSRVRSSCACTTWAKPCRRYGCGTHLTA